MNRFLNWLGKRLFPNKTQAQAAPQPVVPHVRPKPRLTVKDDEVVLTNTGKFKTSTGGQIESRGPGKNVLIRNKYIREDTGTHETLKIVDEFEIDDVDDGQGIDPYNTGRFDRSKSWEKHFRK
jgi:hypothetical protein